MAVSGADPLNLVGTLLPGSRIPALATNRILYCDGVPVAAVVAAEIQWFQALEPARSRVAEEILIRRPIGSPLLAYLR